jgi:hypothetical protein
MNPLDLAECLEALVKNNRDSFVKDAVKTIRSQYAEIEAHKKTNELLSYRLDESLKKCQWYDDKYRLSTESKHISPRELSDEEIAVLKEIIRISDRKHPLWDKAKEFLK